MNITQTKRILIPALVVLVLSSFTLWLKPGGGHRDVLLDYVDTTANPGNDFFSYACGKWVKDNPIPESERSWGIWSKVQEETYNRLLDISKESSIKPGTNGSNAQLIGDFWFSGMDTLTIESQGGQYLQPELTAINNIKDLNGLLQEIGHLQVLGVGPAFSASVSQDEMHSDHYALHFYQGGITLPDRDYYFNTDSRTANIRKEYLPYITNMLALAGDKPAQAGQEAQAIMLLETSMADSSRKLEDLRDPYANYHKMSLDGLQKLCPAVNWKNMMATMMVPAVDSVIVGQPEYYQQLNKLLKKTELATWKSYLRFQLFNTYAPFMSKNFDQEHFHFWGTVFTGVKTQRPRWKRVLDSEEGYLGDALGQLYVQRYFSPATKKRYEKLVDEIFDAYRDRIKQLSWMSETTRMQAIDKLNAVTKKVGYPDKWRDYSSMKVSRASFLQNAMEGNTWQYFYYIHKLNKPVDRTEWDMTPQTYNAYYNPSNNEIVLPAAIFIIPGMPDSLVDDAVVYGYAGGSTIGHEITHGFDDQGRQFDKFGNLKNWWTASDSAQFAQRTQMLVDEFNNYKVLDSMHINGRATLGENLADLGGVNLGLQAFMKTAQYKEGKKISGLTPVQRYFLGYGISWAGKYRDASIAKQIMTDVHSPNFARVNGPVVDIDAFYAAFNIKPGDKMFVAPANRVKVW